MHSGPLRLRNVLFQSEIDVLHLHWLEYAAAPDPAPVTGLARTWFRLTRLLVAIAALRIRGTGVVWTIHNLSAHEPLRPHSQRVLARGVYLLADEVIVHSDHARTRVRATFPRPRGRQPRVIPHGNYVGAFPAEPRRREEVRAGLGLPTDAFVFLAFGVIRRYKRLPLLAEQFRQLRGDDVRLLIAGEPRDAGDVRSLERQAAADPRILLRLGRVEDHAVSGLHLAADAAVLAYSDVFSSGALLLALSCGLPVVAPGLGTARELFAEPAVEFFDGDAIAPALQRIRSEDRRGAAIAAAQRFGWDAVGQQTVAVYRAARRTRSPLLFSF